jgi:isopentenyl diphosphate isomerase/L-lactate dehydrogenase-like FMN-dependent dehydrogenase
MASTKEWFETVAEAQRRARKRLPRSVYMALVAGSEQGLTANDNVAAFNEIGFRPHIADLPQERTQATTVMGQDIAFPVLISPTGVQAVSPEGEDGTPGAIRALPGVVDAVGHQLEVLFDGGIRRGSDVVKALALGARAVLIGRAYLWGMAAGGEQGVANVLQILRSGIDEALLGLGRGSIHDLVPEDLIVPPDFTRVQK